MRIKILLLSMMSISWGFSQTLVSTTPQNKNVILEEFTGVRCGNCPAGHQTASSLQSTYPGQVFVVAYHPTNSSYTSPYSGDPDFSRSYLDAFYQNTYVGSRFMPGAMINRKKYAGERMVSKTSWTANVQGVMNEVSPLNVGLRSTYNSGNNTLTVDVEIYYTQNGIGNHSVYVHIMEDGLTSYQSGAGSNYVHKHMFREAMTPQWGDPITGNITQGTLVTKQYTFNLANAQASINISNAQIIAFVYDATSGENYTGVVVDADGGTTGSTTEITEKKENTFSLNIFPNPVNENFKVELRNIEKISSGEIIIMDLVGKVIYNEKIISEKSIYEFSKADLNLKKGVYFIKTKLGSAIKTKRLVIS